MTLDSANLSAPFANLTSTSHSNQSALLSMTDANKLSLTRTNPVLQSEFRWTRSFLVSWQFVILLFLKSDSSTFLSNSLWCCNAAAAAGSEKDQTQHVAATTAEEQDLIFFFRKKKKKKRRLITLMLPCAECVSAKESRSPLCRIGYVQLLCRCLKQKSEEWTVWLLVIISFSWCSFNQCSSSVWQREENKMKGDI